VVALTTAGHALGRPNAGAGEIPRRGLREGSTVDATSTAILPLAAEPGSAEPECTSRPARLAVILPRTVLGGVAEERSHERYATTPLRRPAAAGLLR
jgi:hypothetical protein